MNPMLYSQNDCDNADTIRIYFHIEIKEEKHERKSRNT